MRVFFTGWHYRNPDVPQDAWCELDGPLPPPDAIVNLAGRQFKVISHEWFPCGDERKPWSFVVIAVNPVR